jgi:mono/diheme cytochrome c family protein
MKQNKMKQTISSQGIKRYLSTILALTSALALTACGGGASNTQNPNTNAGGTSTSSYTGPAPANSDVQAFRVQLWENIRNDSHCGSCHDVGGQGSVAFANNSNVNDAYTAANALVNLNDPASSRMVTKFSGAGHFCWEGSQSACAAQLELWITNWANDRNGSGGRTIQLTAPNDTAPSPARLFPSTVPNTYYSGNGGVNIHTLVTAHCSGCHVPNPTLSALPIAPMFAVGDAQTSYDTARAVPLLNLSVADSSRFYTRLAQDGHNCWTDCATAANQMLSAINYFISGLPAPDMAELNSEVTSRAVSLLEDGIAASGGNRYEASEIALYEFKLGAGDTIIDRSGVSPEMNLTLSGVEGTDYKWAGGWGITFDTDKAKAQASTSASQKLQKMIGATGEYSVEAWVVPGNVTQENANIVSYSGGPMVRNFTLGQHMYNYEMYNRNTSTSTNANGDPLLTTNPDDEDLQASLQHVVVTYDPVNGRRIYVNGIFTDDVDPLPGDSLTNWDPSYALVLGNEISLDRPWKGTIRMLAIHNRALTQEQIKQNFDAGVGQKYFLLFNVSQHLGPECTSTDGKPYCFILLEASQFDNWSYLFDTPRFINLNDANVTPSNIHIKGIRIGINGREASNGQAFANLDVCVNGACAPTNAPYVTGTGAQLSSIGTVIAMENGPKPSPTSGLQPDKIFLTFEVLGNDTPSKNYSENFPTTPTAMNPPAVSDVMMHTFEEINASLAAMTGVPRTVAAINFDNSIDGSGTNGTYTQVIQGLPSSPEISGFVPAQQMSITQLAITYCDQLVEGKGNTAPGTYFSGITFNGSSQPNLSFSTTTDRNMIIDPLLAQVFNVDGATELSTMPAASTVRSDLDNLITGLTASTTPSACGTSPTDTCGYTRTKTIIKATCAAAMASAPMLLQ